MVHRGHARRYDPHAIVCSVIALAHGMQSTVVAEGVETQDQLAFLRQHQCEEMQGWLLGHPMSASEFAHWQGTRRLQTNGVEGYLP
ncbi:MAG: EAL domain-containing protein [Rhodoferax sp.]|nr:EAL domain-containing protein [Rhodoferax sp.]